MTGGESGLSAVGIIRQRVGPSDDLGFVIDAISEFFVKMTGSEIVGKVIRQDRGTHRQLAWHLGHDPYLCGESFRRCPCERSETHPICRSGGHY